MDLSMHEPPKDGMADLSTPELTAGPQKPALPRGHISDIAARGDFQFTSRPVRPAAPTQPVATPVAKIQPAPEEVINENPTPPTEQPEVATKQTSDWPKPDQPKKRRRLPIVIVLVAAIVTILLAAGMVYAFARTNKKAQSTNQTPHTTTSIKSTDVDTASLQIQKDIDGLNNTTDFGSTSLNDQALGIQ